MYIVAEYFNYDFKWVFQSLDEDFKAIGLGSINTSEDSAPVMNKNEEVKGPWWMNPLCNILTHDIRLKHDLDDAMVRQGVVMRPLTLG